MKNFCFCNGFNRSLRRTWDQRSSKFCIETSSNLCFYIGEQGPRESRIWDLTFQFIYGDGEATSDSEFPEQVGRCMNVKSSEFCFLGRTIRTGGLAKCRNMERNKFKLYFTKAILESPP